MKKIAVIGTGYVGLVTGTCFAELGNDVTCVDVVKEKVEMMQKGHVPIYEPGLEDLFRRNIAEGRLNFTLDLAAAVREAEVVFLALPTPSASDGSANLSFVYDVADQLGPLLKRHTVIIDKSTVPVGTAEEVTARVRKGATVEFDVVSNPEFLREGFAVQDFMEPDRIVVGADSPRAREVMADLYEPITRQDHPLLFMSARSAELTKYAGNSFLAAKITFMNQIANLCEELGADVDDVRRGIGHDGRIGQRFLYPGIGYGGSCFPKDVLALIHTAEQYHFDFDLLKTIIKNNSDQQKVLVRKVQQYFGGDVRGKTFALWGLAFKPETDDIREAPALTMIHLLTEAGAVVRAYDPQAMPNVQKMMGDKPGLIFAKDEFEAAKDADALLIATEWHQFGAASLSRLKQTLKQPVVFDGRNIFSPDDMQKAGFYYESIGRRIVRQDTNK
ncbi:MAG TPA: UDP-glucose/GDP-mannose dehydrogenase family protein [Candidatus Saccharimonadales bacterium]